MLETALQLTEEHEPQTQQFLLLAGALRSLAEHNHDAGLVLDAYLLRSLAIAGLAPSFVDCVQVRRAGPHRAFHVQAGGAVCSALPPARLERPVPGDVRAARIAAHRRLGRLADASD